MAVSIDFAAVTPIISVTYLDNNGNRANTTHYPPAGASFAEVSAAALRLAGFLDAVTLAEIEKVDVKYEGLNTAVGLPPVDSNVKEKLHLAFKSTNRRAKYSFDVPSPTTAAEVLNTDVANLGEAALNALIDDVLNGAWGANNGLRTATDFDLTALDAAFYTARNREPNR